MTETRNPGKRVRSTAILIFIVLMLVPVITGGAVDKQPPRNPNYSLIYKHVSRYNPVNAPRIAYHLSRAQRPILMAAIAKVESRYDINARGSSGEITIFQLLKPPRDLHPHDIKRALSLAERHINEDERDTKSLEKAIRLYNGRLTNPKTKLYLERVKQAMSDILAEPLDDQS